jgi:GH25 family lysozyme M1 (1,4-beta-N-acetylmuramidase)
MSIQGCDISHYQGKIDWKKVPLKFAVLKATQGTGYVDPTFYNNRLEARKNDILCGAYHFCDGNDVNAECDHFLSTIGEMLEGEFLALDYEIHLKDPVKWCETFLDRCYEKTGIRPLIYLNQATLNGFNWKPCITYGLWIARYGAEPVLKDFPFIVMHQYSSKGNVNGIVGNVDMDTAFVNLDTLKKSYGKPAIITQEIAQEITPPETPKPEVLPDVYHEPENPTTGQISANNDTPQVQSQSVWQKFINFLIYLIKNL